MYINYIGVSRFFFSFLKKFKKIVGKIKFGDDFISVPGKQIYKIVVIKETRRLLLIKL